MTGQRVRVGWVVDAQVDFMDADGRLYVKDLGDAADPGSKLIVPRLEKAVRWMEGACDVVVYTGDWHGLDDEEIDPVNPDPAAGTYPPHCMGRSDDPRERAGAEIIADIRPSDPLVLEHDATAADAHALAVRAVSESRPVFVHKTRFDVFVGNPATEALLAGLAEALDARPDFVVVGVARDVCVTQAVDGFLARGHAVTALSDVTWGLGLEEEEATLARWAGGGGIVTTLDALIAAG